MILLQDPNDDYCLKKTVSNKNKNAPISHLTQRFKQMQLESQTVSRSKAYATMTTSRAGMAAEIKDRARQVSTHQMSHGAKQY